MKKCEKDSSFNFYLKNVSGDSGFKNLIFCLEVEPENKNMLYVLHLLTYNLQFYYFPCGYSFTYLLTQISFENLFHGVLQS